MQFLASITDAEHNLLTDLTVGQILALMTTLGAIFLFIRRVAPISKRLTHLLDDWFGEESRPGVRERKGVMQRLSDQDQQLTDLRSRVDPVVRDDIAGNHREVLARLDAINTTISANQYRLEHVERLLRRHIRESKTWVQAVDEKARSVDFVVPPWPTLTEEDPE